MAHVVKIKSSGMAAMVGHYNREAERRGYERDNIDPSRTAGNYAVGAPDTDALAAMVRQRVAEAVESHEKASGRSLRKDANVLADWVVTCPQDCPEGLRGRFFEAVVSFLQERYGKENVPGGFVHMDESRPHIHVPVVPVRGGRLVASKVIDRADLRSFHGDLGESVDRELGFHVSIELSEEQRGEKQLSALSQREYVAAKESLRETRAAVEAERERLERLQREAGAAEVECRDGEAALAEARGAREAAEGRVERLEAAIRAVIGAVGEAVAALAHTAYFAARDFFGFDRGQAVDRAVEAVADEPECGIDELMADAFEAADLYGIAGDDRGDDLWLR